MIKIYDTMTRSLQDFIPLNEGKVNMYVCGPTVYNYIHIGNARSVVAFDTIRRYFEYCGYQVNYISNFTDVDDKIIKGAAEAGMDTKSFSDKFISAFMEDVAALGVKPATKNPRVIDYMDEIIDFVKVLVDKEFAYEANGDVYFRVSKSHHYAKLANKTLEDLEIGASGRVDGEGEIKENPLDFVLWKSAKSGEVSWESPWGKGRPGWHIECSVMATEILGDTIDIHGGGADLEFPHHTNEIAQSEAKTGKTFANYWMHNGFVNVDNEKMSKSLGNFITVHDMLKSVDGQVIRFFLATQQYRKPVNFTEKAVHDAEVNLKYLKNTFNLPIQEKANDEELEQFVKAFQEAMDDDFNTANGITVIFEMAKWINSGHYTSKVKETLAELLEIFGIVFQEEVLDADIESLIEQRQEARANRDFATADRIRDELAKQGIKLLDTKDGVRWTRD
ncbi:Cysteine--tRNA ligase [Streptococcus agalactiae]|nr:Cysteine--tRNA ligase [Streptococcus agalactiae]EJZ02803.1 cysteinyl-tRNA synthetase [Streptococcus agalactiae STIR-CD-17]EPU05104.1 cysteinyl-tRNA synthease [Streptococcus agalactiae STIR-CD-09]EPU06159.1 cysteinyl-tRNA synthease [Streptococcus agalactiae STIR-CD-13]EPW90550.1 cysteinyl-tRNA synthease [Streptococcus agalactiae STIR-CD-07]CCQ75896.1 cysteinyl-tRNA synthetase [Streptococcus agalactiae SS1219]CCQ78867.1 cysteinyl-tRNA synthetase [Streptococcus agalactiae LADL-90-503]